MSQIIHRSDEVGGEPRAHSGSSSPSTRSKRFSRYTLVSVGAATTNALLYRLLLGASMSAALANVGAATTVIVPTYLVHRRWTWRVRSPEARVRSGVFYWIFSMANVTMSTTVAWWLARRGVADGALVAATGGIYALTWLVRFAFLDNVLFRRRGQIPAEPKR